MLPSPPLFSSIPPTIRALLARSRPLLQLPTSSSTPGPRREQPSLLKRGESSSRSSAAHFESGAGPTQLTTNTEAESPRVTAQGWVRSVRGHKNVSFVTVSDGTTSEPLQAVYKGTLPEHVTIGSSVSLEGQLKRSKGRGQDIELSIDNLKVIGGCDASEYPIQKKNLPDKVLRDHAHLRFRTTQTAALMALRDGVMRDWHDWFEQHDFTYMHTPILTSSDCEGAGEAFSLAGCGPSLPSSSTTPAAPPVGSSSAQAESPGHLFPRPINLTVSSQLHLEAPTHALTRTYTLSPCFRAEPSATSRHLAEFYMLEGEVAFIDNLDHLMDIVEKGMRATLREMLEGDGARAHRMRQSMDALKQARELKEAEEGQEDRTEVKRNIEQELRDASSRDFARIDYTSAITKLQEQHRSRPFTHEPTWEAGLALEHEKWLAEHYARPVFVTHYPSALKPFYMLPSDASFRSDETAVSPPGPTVACFDLLLPSLGEIAGGSLREHRLPELLASMQKHGLGEEEYQWYLDLRKYGSVPHGGWGMGWDRWISWVSGVGNVKDVVGFPRWLGHCDS